MIFSTRSEYGVMMLTVLAKNYGKGPLSLTEVADQLGLSVSAPEQVEPATDSDSNRHKRGSGLTVSYLEQIVPALRKHGFVESVRGAKGGYILARSPETIKMGAVIRALEGRIAVMGCATDDDNLVCNHEHVCSAPVLWLRVRDAITQALDSTTLADLAPNPRRMLNMALGSQFGANQQEGNEPVGAMFSTEASNN
jgi:Rrf2 family protein